MCHFEEHIFECKHSVLNLKAYCHQSRNHPRHECYNARSLCNSWFQKRWCNVCLKAARDAGLSSGDDSTGDDSTGGAQGPGGHRKDPRGPFVTGMDALQ